MIQAALKGADSWLATSSAARSADILRPPIVLAGADFDLMKQTVTRLQRLQMYVGHGNFNLLGFDQALRLAQNSASVSAFTKAEINFLEAIFFADATRYGFLGDKVSHEITATIPERETIKVLNSGHYLFKGESLDFYHRIKRDVGPDLILTSGIRGIVKQMHLFLSKALATEGNLSLASRHLAPPGHSYHGVGDFDVGKRGFGRKNFSTEFARTEAFQRLLSLGYVQIRYPEGNPYGVRYEPWHIRVVT
jgi:hypothetical protein